MLKKILFKVHSKQFTQFAFTLAETLIVMGIIGVVAALTLPNLNSSTGDKEKVTKVKKIYSNLEDAVGRAQAVYGPVDEWCASSPRSCRNRHFERITEFLKVSKVCNTVSSCPNLAFGANGSSNGGGGNTLYKEHTVILADGTTVGFINDTTDDVAPGYITFDIDGTNKGANIEGKDVFKVCYDTNGLNTVDPPCKNGTSASPDAHVYIYSGDNYFNIFDATYWIINFDNMDYLKTTDGTTCPDGKTKLTFGGNHSCK